MSKAHRYEIDNIEKTQVKYQNMDKICNYILVKTFEYFPHLVFQSILLQPELDALACIKNIFLAKNL